ncbi:MAG: MGH1-like glycoside hydrolase domain-containing protein [Planctomycetota bacterium]|jgi:hypothetical protein
MSDAESLRLLAESQRQPGANWKRWGPYLAERQWGTVREANPHDHSPWLSFPHDQARSRAYRWGEDGLLGITDRQCRLCFALALWNGRDSILKERLFGLSNHEGNHGEDVKEAYFYLDSTPTHSFMRALYKYPQRPFPYDELRKTNETLSRVDGEYELTDAGLFDGDRYFDVQVEYAKAEAEDILIRITVSNRGPRSAPVHVLPTLWFRNTWQDNATFEADWAHPVIEQAGDAAVVAKHETLGRFHLHAAAGPYGVAPHWLFTENETNKDLLEKGLKGGAPGCKDAFHEYVIHGRETAVNDEPRGTKAAALYVMTVPAGGEVTLRLRLTADELRLDEPFGDEFDAIVAQRQAEADAFFADKAPAALTEDETRVFRQAYAGLLWTKQFYFYAIPHHPAPGSGEGVTQPPAVYEPNRDWPHLFNRDVISMPDKWEYPWYAAWDSAFHMIPFARLDPRFAKSQLVLFLREWYQHPNGQIPAYEWNFGDVNPPVHAWACWRTYQLTAQQGQGDRLFLSRVFQKLLLNFTWWVNRKDVRGKHVFSGGFLGLDNIGIFDRSRPLPVGGHLEQADGTAWMAFYCSSMLSIAFELARENPAYEDMASKFFEHYVSIAEAMNSLDGTGLWDDEDGFYYDHLHINGNNIPLRIRSMVGIIPLFTVDVLDQRVIDRLPGFKRRLDWFQTRKQPLSDAMTFMQSEGGRNNNPLRLLAIPTEQRLRSILKYVLDEDEFLSDYGVRSLSKYHEENPFTFHVHGREETVRYVPGESDSGMFGGNSNWRGPIWFPLNYLLIEAFERYHQFYGDEFQVECPTGSGQMMNLRQVANEIRRRLVRLFLSDKKGIRPCYARGDRFVDDPHWKDLVLFYEYFHGDTGRGMGASHQTGWTALVAPILDSYVREQMSEPVAFRRSQQG